jgi:diaminopimelate epimerase
MQKIKNFAKTHAGRSFVKMHGLRNHFVIVDARTTAYRPDDAEIVRICDPRSGVGADQLIIVEPPSAAGNEAGASAFMRILNVDAREVEACGNATRCIAWLLLQESGEQQMIVETLAGPLACRIAGDRLVSCEMGRITMDWQKIPLAEKRDTCHLELPSGPLDDAVALNIGNPHVVYFVNDLDAIDIEACAPPIQQHPLFPAQVNVGVAQLESSDRMRLKVYERGAGLTSACGSGACVAAFAALARGLTDQRRMTVAMPAGEVVIEISAEGVATMTGPVAYCFSGIL